MKVVSKKLISLQKPAANKPVQLGYRRQIPDNKDNILDTQVLEGECKQKVPLNSTRRPLMIRRNNFVSEDRSLNRVIKLNNLLQTVNTRNDQ